MASHFSPKSDCRKIALFFVSCLLCVRVHTITSRPEDLPAIFEAVQKRRGDPWPVNTTDCSGFDAWVARRKAFRQGSLEKLQSMHEVVLQLQESGSTGQSVQTETLNAPLLNDAETLCLAVEMQVAVVDERNFITASRGCQSLADFRITAVRLWHDVEQLTYLLMKRRLPSCFYEVLATYIAVLREFPKLPTLSQGPVRLLDGNSFNSIGLFYNTLLYLPEVPAVSHVINPAFDFNLAQQRYSHTDPHIVVADNFLAPAALDALVTMALESTVWFDMKETYVGAYAQSGLANDILLRLVQELRTGFPDIIGDLELLELWAYKYEQNNSGIKLHADGAVVNLNFWVIPDSANMDETSGGMIVYLKEPTEDVDHYSFNRLGDFSAREAFIQDAASLTIPYRCNRVVIFQSSLIHATDVHHFRSGYESRRINFTLLFGRLPKFMEAYTSEKPSATS